MKFKIYALAIFVVLATISFAAYYTKKADNSPNISASQQKDIEFKKFLGDWKVTKIIGYAAIYDGEDAEKVTDKQISYLAEEAKNSVSSIKQPLYKLKKFSKDDFVQWYRASFENLGITEDSITQVEVTSKDDIPWNDIGAIFLIKDKDTLILPYNGIFYEMKRVK